MLHKAVSYSLEKGGGADVGKKSPPDAAHFTVRGMGTVFTDHKSVLAARLAPERLT